MPETTSHGVQYHVLPDDPLVALVRGGRTVIDGVIFHTDRE